MAYAPTDWVNDVTPLDEAHMDHIEAGIVALDTGKVDKDSVVVAATRIVASKLLAADGNAAFRILGDGQIHWGAGGATVSDVMLWRNTAQELTTSGFFTATRGFGTAKNLYLGADYPDGRILMGAASDAPIWRAGVNQIGVGGIIADGSITAAAGANRIILNTDNLIYWGAAADTSLGRVGANQLQTGGYFYAGNAIYANRGQTYQTGLVAYTGAYSGVDFNGAAIYFYSPWAVLRSTSDFYSNGNLIAHVDDSMRTDVGQVYGGVSGITFGSNDVKLAREAAKMLRSDGVLGSTFGGRHAYFGGGAYTPENGWLSSWWGGSVRWDGTNWINENGGGNNGWGMWSTDGGGGGLNFYAEPATGAVNRTYTPAQMLNLRKFAIGPDGKIYFGTGIGGDTFIYRNAASQLRTTAQLILSKVGTALSLYTANNYDTWNISSDGAMRWGDSVNPSDITLYRYSAGNLRTSETFWALQFVSSASKVYLGSQLDTWIERSAANVALINSALTLGNYLHVAGHLYTESFATTAVWGPGAAGKYRLYSGYVAATTDGNGQYRVNFGRTFTNVLGVCVQNTGAQHLNVFWSAVGVDANGFTLAGWTVGNISLGAQAFNIYWMAFGY